MLRPIAAGLMGLGFVALSVAATRGQDEAGKPKSADVTVVEKDAGETAPPAVAVPIQEGELKRIEIRIGEDGAAAIVGEGEKRVEVREGGEVIIFDAKDGKKIVQRVEANPQDGPISARVRRLAGPPVVDPATREAVEKLIAGLKDEVKKLEGEGKKEDAERKQQSIRALEQVLNQALRWGAIAGQPVLPGARSARAAATPAAAEELMKLHARMEELRDQMSKLPEADKEGRARLEQEMAELKKQIVERHERRIAVLPGAGRFSPPGVPAGPLAPGQPVPGLFGGQHFGTRAFIREQSSHADALMQKAHALRHAAEQLKQAGLANQAGELAKQADTFQAEADKFRAQAHHAEDVMNFAGGPAMDLHRSIHELQEQIQQLRKEVAEVRELLQRRQ